MTLYDSSMNNSDEVVLRIASKKGPEYVKDIAGAMGWQLRENGYCKARAIRANAVNTAIKAVSIVNGRTSWAGMSFGVDLSFSPADSGRDPPAEVDEHELEPEQKENGQPATKPSTAIEIHVHECNTSNKPADVVEYKVSGKYARDNNDKSASKLASAISATSIKGKVVRLRCIGPSAVYRAILACCIAKGNVYSNGLESRVVPTWATLKGTDGSSSISLLQIDFWTVSA